MPGLSSWKTPAVLPQDSSAKVCASSSGMAPIENGSADPLRALIRRSACAIMVRVLRPRKSNFTKPTFSTSPIGNCVTTSSVSFAPLNNGTWRVKGSCEITTPAAWVEAWRGEFSSARAVSKTVRTFGSLCTRSFSRGSASRASSKVMFN